MKRQVGWAITCGTKWPVFVFANSLGMSKSQSAKRSLIQSWLNITGTRKQGWAYWRKNGFQCELMNIGFKSRKPKVRKGD